MLENENILISIPIKHPHTRYWCNRCNRCRTGECECIPYRISDTSYWIVYNSPSNNARLYYLLDGGRRVIIDELWSVENARANSFQVSLGGQHSQFENLPEIIKDFVLFNIDMFS